MTSVIDWITNASIAFVLGFMQALPYVLMSNCALLLLAFICYSLSTVR